MSLEPDSHVHFVGIGGFGLSAIAKVMLEELQRHLAGETGLDEVTICVLDSRQHDCFQAALAAVS